MKKIEGYERYCVTVTGEVISNMRKNPHKMRIGVSNSGYGRVELFLNGVKRRFSVHRLVAMAFVPNPDGKPEVNHLNGDKLDNRVANLEWTTHGENLKYSFDHLDRKVWCDGLTGADVPTSIPVVQLTKEGEVVQVFDSAACAGRAGFTAAHVTACCKGKRKTHGGYKWNHKGQ